jgi:hypothetical protein
MKKRRVKGKGTERGRERKISERERKTEKRFVCLKGGRWHNQEKRKRTK